MQGARKEHSVTGKLGEIGGVKYYLGQNMSSTLVFLVVITWTYKNRRVDLRRFSDRALNQQTHSRLPHRFGRLERRMDELFGRFRFWRTVTHAILVGLPMTRFGPPYRRLRKLMALKTRLTIVSIYLNCAALI